MSALDRLQRLPDWPARMTAPVAAAYMGMSHQTFLTRYRDVGRTEGGNVFWAKAQLDAMVRRQFGLDDTAIANPVEDEIAAWKARRERK